MQAEIYDVKVPPMSALIPILARFFLWLGASSPTPDIRIATEAKFAKPQRAKTDIILALGDNVIVTKSV